MNIVLTLGYFSITKVIKVKIRIATLSLVLLLTLALLINLAIVSGVHFILKVYY